MIALGNGDKLMSLTEVLERVRNDIERRGANVEELDFETALLVVAVDEPIDFIRGALRTTGK